MAAAPIRATVNVVVAHAAWNAAVADPAALLRRAARAALAAAKRDRCRIGAAAVSIDVALIDDRAMRDLNHTYRGKNKPTNVLSFPGEPALARGTAKRRVLGDIAIAFDTLRREAKAQGKRLEDHLAHLVVHAVLHLLGYDHESDADAERMEALERKVLAGLGVADPYLARD